MNPFNLETPEEREVRLSLEAQKYHVRLNEKTIDRGLTKSVMFKVFNNLAGNWMKLYFEGSAMGPCSYGEFIDFHEKRLGIKLKGTLSLFDVSNNVLLAKKEI